MRIGIDGRYIADHYPGIGRYTFSLVEALTRIAPEDTFLMAVHPHQSNNRYDLRELAARPNVRLEQFAILPRSPAEQVRWPLAARRWSLDLLHSPYTYKPYVMPCPSVVTIYDLIPLVFPEGFSAAQRLSFRLMISLALRTSAAITVISGATRDDLARYFGLRADRVYVTYLAADASFYPRPAAEVAIIRARYRLPEHYILYVGINKPHKNLPRLVEAYARIGDAPPLVLAGREDPRYPEARVQAEALGLTKRVCFGGDIASADLPALYSGAMLFVFPSLYEGFGLPPLEAMACGAPVICSNTSSLPEVVGDATLTFDPHDVEAIAATMRRALDDAELRESLREGGLAQAAKFSWERTAQETLKAYRARSTDSFAERSVSGRNGLNG
jgi:alpha-1,3-rhamnosyl/mannosyltransferase